MKQLKTNKPFFSVVTCTYNSKKYVKRNLESVKNQKFNNYEHIIVDGYSNDGTREILKKFKSRDVCNLRVYFQKPSGITAAFNEGIRKAKGEYIIHLNSDDYFCDPNILSDVYVNIKSNKFPDWMFGNVLIINNKHEQIGKLPQCFITNKIFNGKLWGILKIIDFIPHQGVFINKNTFKQFGLFDEKIKFLPDYEYWLRIFQHTRYVYINRNISYYTAWNGSRTIARDNKNNVIRSIKSFHRKYTNWYEDALFMLMNYSLFSDLYRRFKYKS